MAINYQNLFEDIGAVVAGADELAAAEADMLTRQNTSAAVWSGNGREDVLDAVGLVQGWEGRRSQLLGWQQQLGALVVARLMHRQTVLDELLVIPGASFESVARALVENMLAENESVLPCEVTVGSVTAAAGNAGNGTVLVTDVLDGVSRPGVGLLDCQGYVGLESELVTESETMSLTCVRDTYADGVEEGQEQFVLWGQSGERWGKDGEFSGEQMAVESVNAGQLVRGGEFENWSDDVPDEWDLDTGTAGVHVLEDNVEMYRGLGCLQMIGDGAQGTIQLSQTLSAGAVVPGKRYCIAMRVKGQAGIVSGALTVRFESPSGGVAAGFSEGEAGTPAQVSMNSASLAAATSWTLQYFWVNVPWDVPADWELVVKVTGTLTSGKSVRVDGLAMQEVVWANGLGWAVVPGDVPFVRGDRFTVAVGNDNAGKFQRWFRKTLGVQLPSYVAPTISETWVA